MRRQRRPVRGLKCSFCSPRASVDARRGEAGQSGIRPDYKNWEGLRPFITDRGKIISRGRTGVCAKHQRKLAREIKRARHLALLPFVARV